MTKQMKPNLENLRASVKNEIETDAQNMSMNDSYHINALTNAVVKRFPTLHNNLSITIHRLNGKAQEVIYTFLIDLEDKKQDAINALAAKAQEIGIPHITELN